MGLLTPPDLTRLVAQGCLACGGKRLAFRTYVDARLPLQGGEPVGKMSWAYDGEAFCDGVYQVRCAACDVEAWSSTACPRCHREGGLATALETPNAHPLPASCPRCEHEEVAYFAMVPAVTAYEGQRAEKAKTDVDLHDEGFHGYQARCKDCGTFAELRDRCMLCDAPAPLRDRA